MDNIDQAIELRFVPVYMAFGSQATKAASDQVDSVSQAYRDGGNMLWLNEIGKAGFSPTVETFMEVFPDMYDLSDNTKLPSYIGSNHYKGKVQKKCLVVALLIYLLPSYDNTHDGFLHNNSQILGKVQRGEHVGRRPAPQTLHVTNVTFNALVFKNRYGVLSYTLSL